MEHDHFRKFNRETNTVKHLIPSSALPARPGYNIAGKPVSVRVNQYKVLKYPTQDVWQYAVSLHS